MKILVATKLVVDYNVKIRVKTDHSAVDINNVRMSMNPFDEIALEEAVRLQEKGIASEVVAISLGPNACQEVLRTALARGANRAILVETSEILQPLSVAKLLKAIVEREQPQIVFLGKQAIDDDSNQTGQMLAALLDWPQGTFVSKVEVVGIGSTPNTLTPNPSPVIPASAGRRGESKKKLLITREIDGGLEKLEIALPAVLTADLRLNDPRHVSLPNIMKAKQKTIDIVKAEELNIDIAPRFNIVKVQPPKQRVAGCRVSTVVELVEKLKEAQVLGDNL